MIGARCRTGVGDLNPEPTVPLPSVAGNLPIAEAAKQHEPAA